MVCQGCIPGGLWSNPPSDQEYCQHPIRSAMTLFGQVLTTSNEKRKTPYFSGGLFFYCISLTIKIFFLLSKLKV